MKEKYSFCAECGEELNDDNYDLAKDAKVPYCDDCCVTLSNKLKIEKKRNKKK